jgi:sulfate transport system substrate-binding protein
VLATIFITFPFVAAELIPLMEEMGKDKFAVIYPSISILAEPPVAIIDKVTRKHGTQEVSAAYLQFLYSAQGQKIIAKHYYRPQDKAAREASAGQFPQLKLFTLGEVFGDWQKAQKTHFNDGGIFDQIYKQ